MEPDETNPLVGMMGARLAGRRAIVTGGSRGIGRAVVRRLAADGAAVVFSYLSDAKAAQETIEQVESDGGTAHAVQADQGDLADLEVLFAEADRLLGGLDILVVNAGKNTPGPIDGVTEAEYDRAMAVNAKGAFFAIQHAARRLSDHGRIVALSTLNTVVPVPGSSVYIGAKSALEGFVAAAARELGGRGITVNTVSPGATDTELLRATNPPEALEQTAGFTALGRLGQPADVADVVAFLAGPDGRWITGQNLRATGGMIV
ncbi:SDR family oxidoreductase [Allonocardiopsis opalescens]|uniref:3-oxoacyl-[acyl-carrier protein] reductase n=1 Tax=Allonocardiopsis opalescens TaxID=1144618 RepID=A0A2T0Q0W8_9ACTN|nr:SDR family oxidoreductase [Allonocardiopsis opalescens]PRX97323.1 3-oxoacyl-[acyl-carrier protein] reductase [Allonocardiopsis opalescens]